jgi:hypothetical protein
MAVRRWSDLSPRVRKAIVVVGLVEAAMKVAVLADLRRRPAHQIHGRKKVWAFAMLANSAGLVPASYFLFGRRRTMRDDGEE